MKTTNKLLSLLTVGCFCASAAPPNAGSVITTNLPPGTSIVNIDSTVDGAAVYTADSFETFWYEPTATAPSLTLPTGTYQFRIVDPNDAGSLYPSLTIAQLDLIYTAWSFGDSAQWTENYLAFSSTAVTDPSEFHLFDGAMAPGPLLSNTFPSAADAYSGTVANGYFDKVRPAPPGRAGAAADYLAQYTFSAPTTVLFVVPDYFLGDNDGGVSVAVTAVPESSTFVLAALGVLGVR